MNGKEIDCILDELGENRVGGKKKAILALHELKISNMEIASMVNSYASYISTVIKTEERKY